MNNVLNRIALNVHSGKPGLLGHCNSKRQIHFFVQN